MLYIYSSIIGEQMKITKEDKKLFKEVYSKYQLKEGILSRLFLSILGRTLRNDKTIATAIKDADDAIENAKSSIESRFNGDKEEVKKAIPQSVRKYLGFDY